MRESATFLLTTMIDVRYASCDFLAKRYKADIAHRPTEPNRSMCDMHLYSSQTKILENETAGRAGVLEVLCAGVSGGFGLRMLAKCIKKTRPTCCFVFQNLRLGGIIL